MPLQAFWKKNDEPESYLDQCYSTPTIFPIRNQEHWVESGKPPFLKSEYRKQRGRTKKGRRQEHDEVMPSRGKKMKRYYVQVKCGSCGKACHNQRTCIRREELQVCIIISLFLYDRVNKKMYCI